MAKVVICNKLMHVEGHIDLAGTVLLLHESIDGSTNKYCFWEKSASISDIKSSIESCWSGISPKRLNYLLAQVALSEKAETAVPILTKKIVMDSSKTHSIHIHSYDSKYLLLLTNLDLFADQLYYKVSIKKVKTSPKTIVDQLKLQHGDFDQLLLSDFINALNQVVEEMNT